MSIASPTEDRLGNSVGSERSASRTIRRWCKGCLASVPALAGTRSLVAVGILRGLVMATALVIQVGYAGAQPIKPAFGPGQAVTIQPQGAAQVALFDFDTGAPALTTFTNTPLDQTSGGITAHFSSPVEPAFSVQSAGTTGYKLSQFSGKYLMANGVGGQVLVIKFSQPLTNISLGFATADFQQVEVPTTLQLTAYMDSNTAPPVGTAVAHGIYNAPEAMPEGTLSFNAGTQSFNLVEIAMLPQAQRASGFLVDNVAVTPLPLVFTNASAASLVPGGSLAAGSLICALGPGLASASQAAYSFPLPATLAKTTVKVTDSLGVARAAPLYYVSSSQIDYVVPDGTAPGTATVTVTSGGQVTASGKIAIDVVAPGLFAANGDGKGAAAASAITIAPNGTQITRPVAHCGAAQGSCVTAPIDLGAGGTEVMLVLYGTGIRGFSSLAAVSVKLGSVTAQVQSAGAIPASAGLDQVRLLIPRTLAGQGEMDLTMSVDGKTANIVRINIK